LGLRVHLNLAGIVAPTAGGLGGLIRLHRELRKRGGQLVLDDVRPSAYEVFVLTRLTNVLDVHPKQGTTHDRRQSSCSAARR
jgi:anti-anti-sigma regulatory factor